MITHGGSLPYVLMHAVIVMHGGSLPYVLTHLRALHVGAMPDGRLMYCYSCRLSAGHGCRACRLIALHVTSITAHLSDVSPC